MQVPQSVPQPNPQTKSEANEDREKPLIAVTCDAETITDKRGQESPRFVIPQTYIQAVLRAGGEPVALPHRSPEHAQRLMAMCDGLLVIGGDFDVPPAFYNEAPHEKLGTLCLPRSEFERALLKEALADQKPVLGVCGGMQLLNVVLGGSLYQDVSLRPGTQLHSQPFDKREPFHAVRLAERSRLHRIFGQSEVGVNSTHHQIVQRVAAGLVVSANAPDGAIEAIEKPGDAFVLGVQWHPEAMHAPEQLKIYQALVAAARG